MGCRNCNNDLTLECGELLYAPCIVIESDLAEFSEFYEATCVTLHDIVPEIYTEIAALRLEDVELDCLEIEGDFSHQKLEELQNAEICAIKEQLAALSNCDFLDCPVEGNLDVDCLEGVDECGITIQIVTIKDLLQTLIDKVCALENP